VRSALSPYLRSLWNITPTLIDITEPQTTRPFLSPLGLHLPLQAPAHEEHDGWFQAAAAHAASHLVFSQHRFDPAGLRPVTQAILGALEDARVEWLASRELPGLRRLWLPFHAVVVSDTPSFEDLLRRLARSLLDPAHHDPHPWVIKARELFFVDDAGDMLALRQPEALRHAASLLGNDIGQMRLQFNARLYEVMPSYRDDNSCLWLQDKQRADTEHEIASTPAAGTAMTMLQRHLYPEWDRLAPMVRRDWCSVLDDTVMVPAPSRPAARRTHLMAQPDGDEFDLDALVDAAIAWRGGLTVEPRVYRRSQATRDAGSTLLLLDTSASTTTVLPAAREAALRAAASITRAGGECAIHSFCSDGRHAVHYTQVKPFNEPLGPSTIERLMSLRSHLSTRLGAALRHATHLIAQRQGALRRVLLLTDGKPHDVDVHDPHYLLEDARQAVREAARSGVLMQCVSLDAAARKPLQRVFGPGRVHSLKAMAATLTR